MAKRVSSKLTSPFLNPTFSKTHTWQLEDFEKP
jgi:hypothetical protein